MSRHFKQLSLTSVAALWLSACATPSLPPKPLPDTATAKLIETTPEQFFNASGAALPLPSQWWAGFNDATLNALIERALSANIQLDVAQANIEIAQAALARTTLETSYSTGSSAGLDIGRAGRPNANITPTLSGVLSASWEYDAFDRIANAIKASELSVEAARQARRDVAVIISSEIALAYVDLRGAQKRLSVAQDNAQTQAQSLDLLQDLLDNGRATSLDLSRAEAQYRTTLANLPRFQATIDSALSRIAVLTGTSASTPDDTLRALRVQARPIPSLQTPLSIGAPQDLLRRRPDIRAAETEIARLLALSDVERARLFPTISFNADVSALFSDTNRLDQLSSFGFGLGPAINWEGPDLRRVRADIDIADAQTARAYKIYEQTVLQALADVEAALSNAANERQRRENLSRAVDAARDARELARLRFEEGLDDFLDVLEAQRTLLDTEDRLAENQLQTTRLAVLTYRELGGL